jgi:hypothetical protein
MSPDSTLGGIMHNAVSCEFIGIFPNAEGSMEVAIAMKSVKSMPMKVSVQGDGWTSQTYKEVAVDVIVSKTS